MSGQLTFPALLGLACLLGVSTTSQAIAQSSARLPPPSTMLGDVRRGPDGQLQLVPHSMRSSPGRIHSGAPNVQAGPPAGTPWTAKDQQPRTPQLQFEEATGN